MYEVSLLLFGMGDYIIQLPYVWYYVVVKSSFKHAREGCECPREHMCFRSLMFSLLGPCELLFFLLPLGPELW